jgi:hypothetical protein
MQHILDFNLLLWYTQAMSEKNLLALEEDRSHSHRVSINEHAWLWKEGDMCSVFYSAIPVFRYHEEDRTGKHIAMIHLVETGLAKASEVAEAFSVHRTTIFRSQKKIEQEGVSGLVEKKTGPKGGKKIKGELEKVIKKLKLQGLSNEAIGQRLGLSTTGVRKALIRIGFKPDKEKIQQVPLLESDAANIHPVGKKEEGRLADVSDTQETEAAIISEHSELREAEIKESAEKESPRGFEISIDEDPGDRSVDRVLARMGLLDDAVPVFCERAKVSFAGFLLAVPAVVSSGVFEVAKKIYGSIGPSFYGLRTTLLTLLMMAILRIKHPEGLKEKAPGNLGLLLGLDRAPEVKTLRRKLTRLALFGKAYEFLKMLAHLRVKTQRKALGYLYIDGFVRAYYGKRKLSKAYVSRRRLAMPGVTDYWVNDQNGEPLFVVPSEANYGLVKMLKPVLREIRSLVGKRPVSVVFDRGGWSPRLFSEILDLGFDIMTYRKGKTRKISKERFQEHSLNIDGRTVGYQLHEQAVRLLKGKLRLRQVTRLREDNHQTQIVTSRWDISAAMVAYRMFERWRQENYFKYMQEEYALDALVDYNFEPVDLATEVASPERKAAEKRLKAAREELAKREKEYGAEAFDHPESLHPSMRKIANSKVRRELGKWRAWVEKLEQKVRSLPKRVTAGEAYKGELVRLSQERKLLTDGIKMIAYQAESALRNILRPHYSRADEEGRKLIVSCFQNSGVLELKDDKLIVTFDPLSSSHRTSALASLCKELNECEVKYPGTEFVLEYRVRYENVA